MKLDNLEQLEKIFREVFELPEVADVRKVRQISHEGWDSLAHVTLMAALEGEFAIALDTSEMLDLTSFEAVRLFLEERGL
jgi:acyl carrier protein